MFNPLVSLFFRPAWKKNEKKQNRNEYDDGDGDDQDKDDDDHKIEEEEGVVPASPSSYKELMKMPYVRRNSNPVESDEDFSKIEEGKVPKSLENQEVGVWIQIRSSVSIK